MIDNFLPDNSGSVVFKIIQVSPTDAKYLVDEYYKNDHKFAIRYDEESSVFRIQKIINKIKAGKWDILSSKGLSSKSCIIFFNNDRYQSFYEGKHRMIALSKLDGVVKSVPFLCAVGWPSNMDEFRNISRERKHFHRPFLENNVIPKINSISSTISFPEEVICNISKKVG